MLTINYGKFLLSLVRLKNLHAKIFKLYLKIKTKGALTGKILFLFANDL